MKFSIKRYAPLSMMLIFPFLGMLYQIVNQPDNQIYNFMTGIDRAIPFVKFFALPYSLWIFYIYACLLYFFIKDVRVYYRSLLTYVVCTLLCYLIYSVFQTTVPRPMLDGDDLFTKLVALIYNRDQPYNCFPSIHCFSCYLFIKALNRSKFRNWRNTTLIYGMSVLIIVSTFFIKQHAIIDAFAGFLIVEVVYHLIIRLEKLVKVVDNKSNTPFGA